MAHTSWTQEASETTQRLDEQLLTAIRLGDASMLEAVRMALREARTLDVAALLEGFRRSPFVTDQEYREAIRWLSSGR